MKKPVYLVESSTNNKDFDFNDIFQNKADAVNLAKNHSAPYVRVSKVMKKQKWHDEQFNNTGAPVDVEFLESDKFSLIFQKGGAK